MQYRTQIGFILLVVTGAFILLRITGFLGIIENEGRALTMPLARTFSTLGSGVRNLFFVSPDEKDLKERNKELEARLTSFAVDYVRLRALEEENTALHLLIKFTNNSGYDGVVSRVIGRNADQNQEVIMIDRGSKDGIEIGMAVIAGEGIFVGKITSLQDRTSLVTLITNKQSHVAASHAGQHMLMGIVEGSGNGTAHLTLVPQTEPLKVNDIIVTAGTEEKIPSNLPIGFVNEVEGKSIDPFKGAALEPLIRPDTLNIVSILRSTALRPHAE